MNPYNEKDALRFFEALEECRKHLLHARYAVNSMTSQLPLNASTLREADSETIQDMDQLVFRYAKLQDAMGGRLFSALLKIFLEPLEDRPMLDKLNRLEKIGILPSVQRWQELREIHNRFAHDYPDDDAMKAEQINAAVVALEDMADILDKVARQLEA